MTASIQTPKSRSLSARVACLLILCLGLIVYGRVARFDFVNFDDNVYVTGNPHVQAGLTLDNVVWSFGSDTHTYWHPMVWLSLMLDTTLFGHDAGGYHLTNLAFHLGNALLIFLLLYRGTGTVVKSLCVALLFTVHPLNVESVAWVVERKNLLSTFFLLMSLCSYQAYASSRRLLPYLIALMCHAFGLMSKPSLVVLPALLLLLDLWPLGRWPRRDSESFVLKKWLRLIAEKIPFGLISILAFCLLMKAMTGEAQVDTSGTVPMGLRIQNAMVGYITYLGQALWPVKLACYYPFPSSIVTWRSVAAALGLLVGTVMALVSIRRAAYLTLGWGWYCIMLLPASGLMQTGLWPATADRFAYVPIIGIFILLVWSVAAYSEQAITGFRIKIAGILLAAVFMVLSLLTWKQLGYWQNGVTLFARNVAITPDNMFAHNNLGNALLREGRTAEAISHYQATLRLAPSYPLAHNNLGVALQQQGHMEQAISAYQNALSFAPDYVDALMNLGVALYKTGHSKEACVYFKQVLAMDPEMVQAKENLALALAGPAANTSPATQQP